MSEEGKEKIRRSVSFGTDLERLWWLVEPEQVFFLKIVMAETG